MNKIILAAWLLALGLAACKQKQQPTAVQTISKAYYTCSMHPQVHEEHPGNCPICGMKLIKVAVSETDHKTADGITLTAEQIKLAGIETDTVRDENTGVEKTLTGTVTADENTSEQLSAKIGGRIQQLFVRTVGEKISSGQAIYSIYSEELQETEKEYLLALQQQKVLHNPDVDYHQLIGAAENKLQLWGLSRIQIKNLAASGKVTATATVYSKVNGTVSELAVHEGDYVTEGMTILKTQSLSELWVQAQIYANEAGSYKQNEAVIVSFPDLGGQPIKSHVEFVNPEISEASKIDLIRVHIPNTQGLIKPGMLAYVSISGGQQHALAVPASSILTDASGNMVWVKNPDGGFTPKMVAVGPGNQTYLPVVSGLSAGDVVVTNGAYLLNSEAIFKNGNKQMGMGGMKM